MRRRKKCKICKVEGSISAEGRCPLCQAAQEAVKAGISYGNYIANHKIAAFKPLPIVLDSAKAKKCKWCGKEFVSSRSTKAYCSDDCRKAKSDAIARKRERPGSPETAKDWMREERVCVICGKAFVPTTKQQISCSAACSLERRKQCNRANRQAYRARKKAEADAE